MQHPTLEEYSLLFHCFSFAWAADGSREIPLKAQHDVPMPLRCKLSYSIVLCSGHQQGVLNCWSIIQAAVASHGSFRVSLNQCVILPMFIDVRCVWKNCTREAFALSAIYFRKIRIYTFWGMIKAMSGEIQWFLSHKHLSFHHFYLKNETRLLRIVNGVTVAQNCHQSIS